MAKSGLTIEIENRLKTYRPANMGGYGIKEKYERYLAFEVPVICNTSHGGLVDAVEVAETTIWLSPTPSCRFSFNKYMREHFMEMEKGDTPKCPRKNKEADRDCNYTLCDWNRNKHNQKDEIMIICYEIKTSLSDFRSKNGHNFVGNMNFYVIPDELYDHVDILAPEDIGIIIYKQGNMRRKRDCNFIDIGHESQKWLMFSTLKKCAVT